MHLSPQWKNFRINILSAMVYTVMYSTVQKSCWSALWWPQQSIWCLVVDPARTLDLFFQQCYTLYAACGHHILSKGSCWSVQLLFRLRDTVKSHWCQKRHTGSINWTASLGKAGTEAGCKPYSVYPFMAWVGSDTTPLAWHSKSLKHS